ncbi:histidine kinase [Luteimonas suaedae]|uniref:histidine kinase n=1 Tax=Luteimonas suaedae TaxID=2605430 RepID=UPI00165907B7|nr:histidine kinase [Luteimonas suaedae]
MTFVAGLLVAGAAALVSGLPITDAAAANTAYPKIETVRVMEGDNLRWASPKFDDHNWQEMRWHGIDPQQRLVWVRAHVTLPKAPALEGAPLAVYVSALAAYEVYWNGERIGASGTPGANESLEIPGKLDTTHYVPPRLMRDGDNVLALKMSSFHLRRTLFSPVHLLAIGEYGRSWAEQMVTQRLPALAAVGALLLGAVYFAAMFLSDRRDHGSLLLSLLSLCVLIQLGAELVRSVSSYDYPLHILRLEIVHVAAIASGLLLVAYVAGRYVTRHRCTLLVLTIIAMAASTALMPGFDNKTAFVILSALLAVIAAAAIGARARVASAAVTAIVTAGLILLLSTGPISFVDQAYYLAAAAFLLFLFAQQVISLRRTQSAQAAAELRSARLELDLLKRQIQPHFLMNALTAVSEWIESDPKTGVRMIEALAGEFRALAAMSGKKLVTLADELELCRRHLEVMSYRKDHKFALNSDDVDITQHLPPATLHTLLENALTHNAYAGGAVFTLEAAKSASRRRSYRLRSPLESRPRGRGRDGRGHAYVRARLQEAFGDDWSFVAGPEGTEWVDTIEIPKA